MPNSEIIDSRQLLNFVKLAETRSFTQTAKSLNLTQSAVSHSIKSLEEDLGCRLFERIGKKVFLTVQGEGLLANANQIIHLMTSARERLIHHSSWGGGRLRIAAASTICEYLVPEILREFNESFIECDLKLRSVDAPSIGPLIANNTVDLGFTIYAEDMDPELQFQEIFRDTLQFAVAPNHPWLERRRLNRRDIEEANILTYTSSSLTQRMILNYLQEHGIKSPNFTEIGNVSTIKELVKIGQGVALLPHWVMEEDRSQGLILTIPMPYGGIERTWGIATLKGRPESLLEETFIGLAQDCCRHRIAPVEVIFE